MERILDRDHYGIRDVKGYVLEYIAIQKLKEAEKNQDEIGGGQNGMGGE